MLLDILIHETVEFSGEGNEARYRLSFVCTFSGLLDFAHGVHNIAKGFNDWIDHATHKVVGGIVVSIANAKHAEDSSGLGKSMLFAALEELGLRKAAAKLSAIATGLLRCPFTEVERNLVVWLSVILEHLGQGICTAQKAEVIEGDFVGDSLHVVRICSGFCNLTLFVFIFNFVDDVHSLGRSQTFIGFSYYQWTHHIVSMTLGSLVSAVFGTSSGHRQKRSVHARGEQNTAARHLHS